MLRTPTRELSKPEIRSEEMQRLVADMVETMREYGGVGLAAPQVHESVRLAVIEALELNERYKISVRQPLLVIFNAKVTVLDETRYGFWEGCLSVPGLRGYVERPRKIRVDYLDAAAEPRSLEAEDFLSTVFQHELDHLDGRLYVEKIAQPDRFAFVEEYQRFHLEDGADTAE